MIIRSSMGLDSRWLPNGKLTSVRGLSNLLTRLIQACYDHLKLSACWRSILSAASVCLCPNVFKSPLPWLDISVALDVRSHNQFRFIHISIERLTSIGHSSSCLVSVTNNLASDGVKMPRANTCSMFVTGYCLSVSTQWKGGRREVETVVIRDQNGYQWKVVC